MSGVQVMVAMDSAGCCVGGTPHEVHSFVSRDTTKPEAAKFAHSRLPHPHTRHHT